MEFPDIRIRNDSWTIMRISTIPTITHIGTIWTITQINAIQITMHIGVAEKATITKMTNIRYYNDLRLACLFIVKSLHR